MYQVKIFDFAAVHGGEGGIRTHDNLAAILVFETSALGLYATSPHRGNLSALRHFYNVTDLNFMLVAPASIGFHYRVHNIRRVIPG